MDRGAWQATVHGVAKSQTGLSNFTTNFTIGHGSNLSAEVPFLPGVLPAQGPQGADE